jgi:hypothetical protein
MQVEKLGLAGGRDVYNWKTHFLVVLLGLSFLLPGCSKVNPGPQELIVGKWATGQGGVKISAEFARDGTAVLTMFGQPLQGTYKIEGDELVWTLNGMTTHHKMKVTADQLEIAGDGGVTVVYKRE